MRVLYANCKNGLVHLSFASLISAPPHALRAPLNARQKAALYAGIEMIYIDYTIPALLAPF